jgi:hypothetical protein
MIAGPGAPWRSGVTDRVLTNGSFHTAFPKAPEKARAAPRADRLPLTWLPARRARGIEISLRMLDAGYKVATFLGPQTRLFTGSFGANLTRAIDVKDLSRLNTVRQVLRPLLCIV